MLRFQALSTLLEKYLLLSQIYSSFLFHSAINTEYLQELVYGFVYYPTKLPNSLSRNVNKVQKFIQKSTIVVSKLYFQTL